MKLSDMILLSDVDGTLLPPHQQIPQRNIEAVRRFTQKGGRFGIATGRSRQWVQELRETLPINAPCVMYNGGVLYDFSSEQALMELVLPDSAKDCLEDICATNSNVSALVVTSGEYFNVKQEQEYANFVKTRRIVRHPSVDWRQITEPWYKILFLVRDGEYDRFMEFVGAKSYPEVRFVGTNSTLIEMLPAKSSKGYALEQLIESGAATREQLVVIGDFYNDLEMIQMAGTGVTLCDSPADLQAQADLVVGNCANGAVADVVEYLERIYWE